MKALILNSGTGSRMGDLTTNTPKCLTTLIDGQTILWRQLHELSQCGIKELVITTGKFHEQIIDAVNEANFDIDVTYVRNNKYDSTNYIYSIYLAQEHLEDDIVMYHGDIVHEFGLLKDMLDVDASLMAISSTAPLPEKDFKAVIDDDNIIRKIGIEFFNNAFAAQPLYALKKNDWLTWLERIKKYCENNTVTCYAENAFNEISQSTCVYGYDVKDKLCMEVDTPEDRLHVINLLKG